MAATPRRKAHFHSPPGPHPTQLTLLIASQPPERLPYSIVSVSSYSGTYHPSLIIQDRPNDLGSRWSGASVPSVSPTVTAASANTGTGQQAASSSSSSAHSTPAPPRQSSAIASPTGPYSGKQYIVLKVSSHPVIVKSIVFGKYHKPHPCNLRDLKVYGGNSPDPHSGRWVRLLRTGLKNDSTPEEFALKWTNADGVPLPIQYIKVVPLATHSPNYNFSVWHVALNGCADRSLVNRASQEYHEFCESTTTRLILKHLRARGHHSAFRELLHSSKLRADQVADDDAQDDINPRPRRRPFEHPVVTRLFQAIMRGDWDTAEECLDQSAAGLQDASSSSSATTSTTNLFASFVQRCTQHAHWKRIYATDADGDIPSPRGGHHMVIDSNHQMAYLFGGWDGKNELNDLWVYYMTESRWRCISRNTTLQGGPSPRSCHKMAFDIRSGLIYIMGRYVDADSATATTTATGGGSGANTPQPPASSSSPGPRSASASAANPPTSNSSFLSGGRASPQQTSSSPGLDASARPTASSNTTLQPEAAAPRTSGGSGTPAWLYASDFYRFSTRSERWDRLSADTQFEGGPKLVYDPDMVVDEEKQMLYVFGGRVAHWDPKHFEYSGMWRYDCIQRTWAFLFDDNNASSDGNKIPSRSGHSMLLDKGDGRRRQVWILGGQRGDQYLADMHVYSLSTGEIRQVNQNYEVNSGGPEGGFTQRGVIDSARREIYLLSGLTKRQQQLQQSGSVPAPIGGKEQSALSLWMYSIVRDTWTMVWQGKGEDAWAEDEEDDDEVEDAQDQSGDAAEPSDKKRPRQDDQGDDGDETMDSGEGEGSPAKSSSTARPAEKQKRKQREPVPRFASSVVFDPKSEHFLLFGGNPTIQTTANDESTQRLDDLWSLRLLRPHTAEVLRRAKFVLRQQRFKEMAAAVPRGMDSEADEPDDEGSTATTTAGGMLAMEALIYLQTEVAAVVDHDEPTESRVFRKLVAGLLGGGGGGGQDDEEKPDDGEEDGEGRLASCTVSPLPPSAVASSREREADGLPAVHFHEDISSDDDDGSMTYNYSSGGGGGASSSTEDSEMLSISQTFPALPRGDGSNTVDLNKMAPLDPSQRPTPLFAQRLDLYRKLLEFYPLEAVEPQGALDLGLCVESYLARGANTLRGAR